METQEKIINRINDRLTIDANKLEGGFSQDIIRSIAYEIANIKDVELDDLRANSFIKTAKTLEALTLIMSDYGFAPRKAQAALVYLEIKGEAGTELNNSIKAIYNNLVYEVLEFKIIPETGTIKVQAQCTSKGKVGNVEPHTITKFATDYVGLTSVDNPEAAFNGFDDEDLETFRQRSLVYVQSDASNANKAQYKIWAQSIVGVEKAIIKGADEGMGAGNVGIYISAIDQKVSEELIQKVKSYIESVQPINATIIVNALKEITISVNATVVLKPEATTEGVTKEFTQKLDKYLKTVEKTVSYLRISDLLFDCAGVEDVKGYTVNGGKVSIDLTDIQTAEVGNVIISR